MYFKKRGNSTALIRTVYIPEEKRSVQKVLGTIPPGVYVMSAVDHKVLEKLKSEERKQLEEWLLEKLEKDRIEHLSQSPERAAKELEIVIRALTTEGEDIAKSVEVVTAKRLLALMDGAKQAIIKRYGELVQGTANQKGATKGAGERKPGNEIGSNVHQLRRPPTSKTNPPETQPETADMPPPPAAERTGARGHLRPEWVAYRDLLIKSGFTDKQIADACGVSKEAVRRKRHEMTNAAPASPPAAPDQLPMFE